MQWEFFFFHHSGKLSIHKSSVMLHVTLIPFFSPLRTYLVIEYLMREFYMNMVH